MNFLTRRDSDQCLECDVILILYFDSQSYFEWACSVVPVGLVQSGLAWRELGTTSEAEVIIRRLQL
jgi:hypothetical protein